MDGVVERSILARQLIAHTTCLTLVPGKAGLLTASEKRQ
jgi:hypothetical protein